MTIQFNPDKPSSRAAERLDRPRTHADVQNGQSHGTEASAQTPDQSALGRAQQLLSAESSRPSVGTPLNSQSEARSVVARLKEQFQRQPEQALSSLASVGLGALALLKNAPRPASASA